MGLFYSVKSGVGPQDFGNDDLPVFLAVFQKSGYHAGQGQGAAVEGVAELGFAIRIFEAAFEAVCLVGLEV